MVDPRAHHEAAHELDNLIEKAQDGGAVTWGEISQVATRTGTSLQQVVRELQSRGVRLPLNGHGEDGEDAEELEEADDDEELDEPRLAADEVEELHDSPLAPAGDEPLMPHHPHHTEEAAAEADVPDAPAAIYLRDISRVSLLTAQQEVSLAKEIELGNQAAERLKQLPVWTEESPGTIWTAITCRARRRAGS